MKQNSPLHPLNALTHLDGRNGHKLVALRPHLSEFAWVRQRLDVMAQYLLFLIEETVIPVKKTPSISSALSTLKNTFSLSDAEEIQEIETTTNHDLRALELWLKKYLKKKKLTIISPFANLGVGSEDINNLAYRLSIRATLHQELIPLITDYLKKVVGLASESQNTPMLARTHGQPASVTTLGKELSLFIHRSVEELQILQTLQLQPKFSGEVGTAGSLKAALPSVNWPRLQTKFVARFGFSTVNPATQIAPYEDLIRLFDSLRRLNQIGLALAKDIWLYTSFNYFKIANISGEAGSSGMPHKVNPIFFEGAEGGFEMANAVIELFSRKFSYNRLQRDFSDSTLRRNVSLIFAYSYLSYQSLITGLNRLAVNPTGLENDLNAHWEVLSETLHTALKLAGRDDAYSLVREQFRGKTIDSRKWRYSVTNAPLPTKERQHLLKLKPSDLVGYAPDITQTILENARRTLQVIAKSTAL